MKRRTAKEKEKELADNARLLRIWRKWHTEQLTEALAGVHADVMGRLMAKLKDLRSARGLVAAIEAEDWTAVDADTRLIALPAPSPNCARSRIWRRSTMRYQENRCAHSNSSVTS